MAIPSIPPTYPFAQATNDEMPGQPPGHFELLRRIDYCEMEWTEASVFSAGLADCAWVVVSACTEEGLPERLWPMAGSWVWLGPSPKLINARLSGIILVCQPWSDWY